MSIFTQPNTTILGILRIKNEARWIEEVIHSILPVCSQVFVFDDHSTDGTPDICEQIDPKVHVQRSTFRGLDETRDKNALLQMAMSAVDISFCDFLSGCATSPYWALAVDGDEVLVPGGGDALLRFISKNPSMHAAKLPIKYLWDSRDKIRVDGVYRSFARPSLFRLMNRAFTFQSTPWGGNFHCSSIPQELLHHAHPVCEGAPLLHLGYLNREDRLRKYEWYNLIDPDNDHEDRYRHMVIGDMFPADSRFKWAGPLSLASL